MSEIERTNKLILMFKNYEVLSFSYESEPKRVVHIIEKLEHFDKAPYGVLHPLYDEDTALLKFFNSRSIAPQRYDYNEILKATNSKNGFELSFKGHGLSLTNHYWFKKEGEKLKYEDINFFTNKWDDSFGRAVLNKDYEKLKNCDLNVPDIVTNGWAVKGWIWDNGPKLYKFSRDKISSAEALGEVLGSRLARRIFPDDQVLHYVLKKIGNNYASAAPVLIGIDEELVPLSNYFKSDVFHTYLKRFNNREVQNEFFKLIEHSGIPGIKEFFIKITCVRHLCFISDLHFDNISIIKNNKTGKLRMSPLYDLAGAFGTSESGRKFVSNINKGTYLVLFYVFNELNPDWDYSWYDPKRLDGFENEIIEILTKSEFYTPELLDRIINVFRYQKEALDKIAKKIK